jgi:hypothetical protein
MAGKYGNASFLVSLLMLLTGFTDVSIYASLERSLLKRPCPAVSHPFAIISIKPNHLKASGLTKPFVLTVSV